MLKLIGLLLVISMMTANRTYAADIDSCSLAECLKLHAKLVARIKILQGKVLPVAAPATTSGFGNIVIKNENSAKYCPREDWEMGKVCWMTQAEANTYCASLGQRLPSLKDFIELAKTLGAKGIAEEADVNNETKQYSHKLIDQLKFKSLDGKTSQLYFNPRGYKHPDGDLGLRTFWTSTEAIVNNETRSSHYSFSSDNGYLKSKLSNSVLAVRCISGR